MPRVLFVCLLVFVGAIAAPRPAAADTIFDGFDARPLASSEKRLLQTALAASGDYHGALDGYWGAESQLALVAYSLRAYGDGPRNAHVGALALGFLDSVAQSGWDFSFLPELGVSLALPLGELKPAEAEEGGERRWSRDGALTVLTHRFTAAEARRWHTASRRANDRPEALTTLRVPDLMITAGELRDGRRFFTRSDRTGAGWATVYLAGAADRLGALNLIASSIAPGEPLPWDLPDGGRLSRLMDGTASFLDSAEASRRPPRVASAAIPPQTAALPRSDGGASSTGTGFYVGARTVVTADHVVAGCGRVTLADDSELAVVASDSELDIAVLMAPDRAPRWLALAEGGLRLGQRVHAAGFPYYSIAGTSLNLTSGNVSALAGVDDDGRFFSFTAPVQPGNSGGPLLDARGRVLGLVVARLSEDYIVEATGSLPQNVNYALGEGEVADFLRRNGVAASAGGIADFDMDEGAPTGFERAVVPILCR